MKKMVETFYDFDAQTYDARYETPYLKMQNDFSWYIIKKYLPRRNGKILDAGGGTGHFAVRLAQLGYEVVLVDISRNMLRVRALKIAQRKVNEKKLADRIKFFRMDLVNMKKFADTSFDMVLCETDVISYIKNYEQAIGELHRVAKLGSYMIASFANRYGYLKHILKRGEIKKLPTYLQVGNIEWVQKGRPSFPIHTFTPTEIRKTLKKAGFKVIALLAKIVFPKAFIKPLILDQNTRDFVLKLALRYSNEIHLFSNAEHIEVVAFKEES